MAKIEPDWNINAMAKYAETESMGLGVFAIRDINKNVEIFCNPARTFSGQNAALLRKSDAYNLFYVDRDSYSPDQVNSPLHLVLGPIAMVNHSDDENCYVNWGLGRDVGSPHAKLFSKRFISSGEELCIKYHNVSEYSFQ